VARPVVSEPAEELYEALEPAFTDGDEERLWAALKLCQALVPTPIRQLHGYVVDQEDGTLGWVIVLDPDAAPAEVLPWLAQFDGAVLRPDMTEVEQRNAITQPEGFGRGRLDPLISITKRHLTGSKTVLVTERSDGTAGDRAWHLYLRTLASETPNPAATEAEVRAEAKPIGIILHYSAITEQTWLDLRTDHASWTLVRSGGAEPYATWLAARTALP
jgi:hypothetical protein